MLRVKCGESMAASGPDWDRRGRRGRSRDGWLGDM